MKAIISLLTLAVAGWAGHAQAQHGTHGGAGATAPYAGLQQRDIKALSPEDTRRLADGHGMSLALAAELNGYPGPSHVLEHADALELTSAQRERTQALMQRHKAKARELGATVVQAERELDQAFARRTATEADVARLTARIGALQGDLRGEHLRTHLEQTALLTPAQVARYQHLRGYAVDTAPPAHGGHR